MALKEAVSRFCDGEYPAEKRGDALNIDQLKKRKSALAEMGLLGLPFSSDFGGSEQSSIEVLLVAQELGQALDDGVFTSSTVMAGSLIDQLGSHDQKKHWLASLATGEKQAALAAYEAGARYDWHLTDTRAELTPEGWVLNGRKTMVFQGSSADLFLVVARTSGTTHDTDGLSVFMLPSNTPGLVIEAFDTLDNRRAAHLTLQNLKLSEDQLLGLPGHAFIAVEKSIDRGIAALCAEAVGAVEILLAMTVIHLKTRQQFGSPLAKFQVLQHRIANMAMDLEQLKSMACVAAMALNSSDTAQRKKLISAAKVLTSQKGREIGLAAIQLHGAMGMTEECRVGHYAKRLMVIGQSLGDAHWHLHRMTQLQ